MDDPGIQHRNVDRIQDTGTHSLTDALVVERPLQFIANETPLLTTMRTPGHDEELVIGHLLTEGVIRDTSDALIELKPGDDVDIACVALRRGAPTDALMALRRVGVSVSSCGVCGRVEKPEATTRPVSGLVVAPQEGGAMLRHMTGGQTLFAQTGGIHAAALFDRPDAPPLVVREDIGRHNAVDKVIGWLCNQRRWSQPLALTTSGRASYEILHKAAAAGIGTVISVSAASTLAVDTAQQHGITLMGFFRGDKAVVYHRVTP